MKIFDLHSDFPTSLEDFSKINFNNNSVIGAVYSGNLTFNKAIETATKVKSSGFRLAFENIGYNEVDFDKIIKVQLDNEYKKILSDYVINTDKTLGLLKVELIELIERL